MNGGLVINKENNVHNVNITLDYRLLKHPIITQSARRVHIVNDLK